LSKSSPQSFLASDTSKD
jgi:hypothetical protein